MGKIVYQRIHECAECGIIPPDGEKMWEMSGRVLCEKCSDAESGI